MVVLNTEEIQQFIASNPNKLIIIDFYAQWCGPCKRIEPLVAKLESDYDNKILVRKVDVDESDDFAKTMEIGAMPTFIFILRGKEIDRHVGSDMDGLNKKIRQHL